MFTAVELPVFFLGVWERNVIPLLSDGAAQQSFFVVLFMMIQMFIFLVDERSELQAGQFNFQPHAALKLEYTFQHS